MDSEFSPGDTDFYFRGVRISVTKNRDYVIVVGVNDYICVSQPNWFERLLGDSFSRRIIKAVEKTLSQDAEIKARNDAILAAVKTLTESENA